MLFSCTDCEYEKEVGEKYAGKKVKCPKCGIVNLMPAKILSPVLQADVLQTETISAKSPSSQSPIKTEIKSDQVINGIQPLVLNQLIENFKPKKLSQKIESQNDFILELESNGEYWIKNSGIVGTLGVLDSEISNAPSIKEKNFLRKILRPKKLQYQKMKGKGSILIGETGKKIITLKLKSETININLENLLGFSSSLKWDIERVESSKSLFANEIFSIKISGTGELFLSCESLPVAWPVAGKDHFGASDKAIIAWANGMSIEYRPVDKKSNREPLVDFSGKGFVLLNSKTTQSSFSGNDSHKPPVQMLAMVAILFAIFLVMPTGGNGTNMRLPASSSEAGNIENQIRSTQGQIQRLELAIKQKGTAATEQDHQKLRRLKQSLLDLQDQL